MNIAIDLVCTNVNSGTKSYNMNLAMTTDISSTILSIEVSSIISSKLNVNGVVNKIFLFDCSNLGFATLVWLYLMPILSEVLGLFFLMVEANLL